MRWQASEPRSSINSRSSLTVQPNWIEGPSRSSAILADIRRFSCIQEKHILSSVCKIYIPHIPMLSAHDMLTLHHRSLRYLKMQYLTLPCVYMYTLLCRPSLTSSCLALPFKRWLPVSHGSGVCCVSLIIASVCLSVCFHFQFNIFIPLLSKRRPTSILQLPSIIVLPALISQHLIVLHMRRAACTSRLL